METTTQTEEVVETTTTATTAKSSTIDKPMPAVLPSMLTSVKPRLVNYRAGKTNTIICDKIVCKEVNATGRRLSLEFFLKGKLILERRVYSEWYEKMREEFAKKPVEKKPVAVSAASSKTQSLKEPVVSKESEAVELADA